MNPELAYYKCNHKINKDLEPYFIKDPQWAYRYALNIIKYRWLEAERYITKDPEWAYRYALNVIKGRWTRAERYIIKDPCYAYSYAKDIIKGRWLEAEQYIIKDSQWTYWYASNIIKGKLPENMHNMMLLHALRTDNRAKLYYAKNYFKFIKNKTQP
jgi:hypothetical protein